MAVSSKNSSPRPSGAHLQRHYKKIRHLRVTILTQMTETKKLYSVNQSAINQILDDLFLRKYFPSILFLQLYSST